MLSRATGYSDIRSFENLKRIDPLTVANYLKNEYPLTVHLNRIKQEIPIILQRIFSGR